MGVLKDKSLALFLEPYGSLELWNKIGLLKREITLYNLLSNKFKKIYIFTYGSKKDLMYKELLADNIEIIVKSNNTCNYFYQFYTPFKFRKILKDCYFYKTNQINGAVAPFICKLFYNNKLIVRGGYITSLSAKFYRLPIKFRIYHSLIEFFSYLVCDIAFIPTKSQCDILIKKYPFLKKKLMQLNNFIDTNLFVKKKELKKYDIIYVARLHRVKNHIELLKAIKGLNLNLCFIGQGPEEKKISKFAKLNSINLNIIKRVPNDNLPFYYNSSKICVFPSLFEGNPKTLLEAMSCELPVIGCDVIGVNNLIKPKYNGLLCQPTAESLRAAITGLLMDKKLQKRLGKNARVYIQKNFSLKKLVKKEIKIYERLTEYGI